MGGEVYSIENDLDQLSSLSGRGGGGERGAGRRSPPCATCTCMPMAESYHWWAGSTVPSPFPAPLLAVSPNMWSPGDGTHRGKEGSGGGVQRGGIIEEGSELAAHHRGVFRWTGGGRHGRRGGGKRSPRGRCAGCSAEQAAQGLHEGWLLKNLLWLLQGCAGCSKFALAAQRCVLESFRGSAQRSRLRKGE